MSELTDDSSNVICSKYAAEYFPQVVQDKDTWQLFFKESHSLKLIVRKY